MRVLMPVEQRQHGYGEVSASRSSRKNGMNLRRAAIVVISVLVASLFLVVGISLADPVAAQAAGGGYVKKCGGGKILLNDKEKRAFALHNAIRRQHKLSTLCVHPRLQKAARAHSRDMIRRDYFSHGTKGRHENFLKRIKRYGYGPEGYTRYLVGENIAYGSGSSGEPQNITKAWMHSKPHRRNILNGKFREIGIGAHTGNWRGHDGVTMYTADFGLRRR